MHAQEEHDEAGTGGPGSRVAVTETMRSAATSGTTKIKGKKDDEHMSLFWRVFGGTILSISALVVMTLYNNLAGGISDLRADLAKERDARGDMVKKDDFNGRSSNIYERIRQLDGLKADIEGLKERTSTNTTAIEGMKKDAAAAVEELKKDVTATVDGLKKDVAATADQVKKDEALSDVLKERVATVESVKKDVASLESLKDKVSGVSADLKSMREDVLKLQADSDRNRSGDLERKTTQELQLKQLDDSLKDLQKGLQDCREKLARLEGALPGKAAPAKP